MISLGDTQQALAIAEAENVKLKEDMAMKLIPEASQDPLAGSVTPSGVRVIDLIEGKTFLS